MHFRPPPLSDGLITIHDITSGNVQKLGAMLTLYQTLFPDYRHYLPYLQELAHRPAMADPRFVEHQWLIEVGGEAAGIINFTYVPARGYGLLMELGVHPSFRTMRVGMHERLASFMIASAVAQLRADAELQGRPAPLGLIVEIPSPKSTEDALLQQGRQRLRERYHSYGFVDLPVEYFEPPTVEGYPMEGMPEPAARDFQRMELALLPIQKMPFDPSDPQMLKEVIGALLLDHYGLDETHWAVQQALCTHQGG